MKCPLCQTVRRTNPLPVLPANPTPRDMLVYKQARAQFTPEYEVTADGCAGRGPSVVVNGQLLMTCPNPNDGVTDESKRLRDMHGPDGIVLMNPKIWADRCDAATTAGACALRDGDKAMATAAATAALATFDDKAATEAARV